MHVMCIMSSVCLRLSWYFVPLITFCAMYRAAFYQLNYFILMTVRRCVLHLIIIRSEIWVINLFGIKSWNNDINCMPWSAILYFRLQNTMGMSLRLTTIAFLSFAIVYGQFHLTLLSVNLPNRGFYCPDNGIATSYTYTTQHLCKLACSQSTACVAINFNLSDSLCTRLITPCLRANFKITMQYTLFSQRRIQACYQWQKRFTVSTNNPRLILNEERSRIVSRLLFRSGYYPSYYALSVGECFGGTGSMLISSYNQACEMLLVEPRCTVGWTPDQHGVCWSNDYRWTHLRRSILHDKSATATNHWILYYRIGRSLWYLQRRSPDIDLNGNSGCAIRQCFGKGSNHW